MPFGIVSGLQYGFPCPSWHDPWLLLQLHLPHLCSFHVIAPFLPFSNICVLFHGSLCQGHLPPLDSFTLFLLKDVIQYRLALEAFLTSHLGRLGVVVLCLCAPMAPSLPPSEHLLSYSTMFSFFLYCEILEGNSSFLLKASEASTVPGVHYSQCSMLSNSSN